jgi:hypothetical protein
LLKLDRFIEWIKELVDKYPEGYREGRCPKPEPVTEPINLVYLNALPFPCRDLDREGQENTNNREGKGREVFK